jgi:hypothetical protein
MWNLNAAKSSCRYIYEKEENLQIWYEENLNDFEDLVDETIELDFDNNLDDDDSFANEIIETWVVVLEQKKILYGIAYHYHSRNDSTFFQDLQEIHYEEPENDPGIEYKTGLDFE